MKLDIGEEASAYIGVSHEVFGVRNSSEDRAMDLHNNLEGLKAADEANGEKSRLRTYVAIELMMERLKSMHLSKIVNIAIASGIFLAGCAPGVGGSITDTILNAQDGFLLSDAFDEPVSEAYVFCEYHDEERGEGLGFKRSDFFSINRNYKTWETHTGIGVKFKDGKEDPTVEWFDPTKIDACPGSDSYKKIDPENPINIEKKIVEFSSAGSSLGEKEVKTLHYQEWKLAPVGSGVKA
ncbi:hypothetical protein V5T06_06485 [Corynebacterium mastitidis]